MRELANQRAQAVRDAILATGQAGADRLFLVAAKPLSAEERARPKADLTASISLSNRAVASIHYRAAPA